jgi:hypothetical protein
MSKYPKCTDCKYYTRRGFIFKKELCAHPNAMYESLVTGKREIFRSPIDYRLNGMCSFDAQLFESKNSQCTPMDCGCENSNVVQLRRKT